MDDVLKAIEALQRTPILNLIIILGGVFLLLAFVSRIGATIEMPPGRQKLAGLVGMLFLIVEIAISLPTNQGRVLPKERQEETQPGPNAPKPPAGPQETGGPITSGRVNPASGAEVKVGPLVYRILSVQIDHSIPGKFSLWFTIRLTTRGGDALLQHTSFRLLVDDVPRAPEMDRFARWFIPEHPRLNQWVCLQLHFGHFE